MDFTQVTIDDAIYWAELVNKHLDEALALAQKLDEETNLSTLEEHSPFRIRVKLEGIKARNQHVLADLGTLKSETGKTTTS